MQFLAVDLFWVKETELASREAARRREERHCRPLAPGHVIWGLIQLTPVIVLGVTSGSGLYSEVGIATYLCRYMLCDNLAQVRHYSGIPSIIPVDVFSSVCGE